MVFWTNSSGIAKRGDIISTCLNRRLFKLNPYSKIKADDVFVGWGNKANTIKIQKLAKKYCQPYLRLEDGFIGYIGHPAKKGLAVSLVADNEGIYYDSFKPSQLETYIKQPLNEKELARAGALIQKVVGLGISKYNLSYPQIDLQNVDLNLKTSDKEKILLIDQVAGDLSLRGAQSDTSSFHKMIATARREHPNAQLYLRTHPDTRLGKKCGVLAQMHLEDVIILDQPCHPHHLIQQMDAVYTVSSQMGFEALLLGKPVYCFGLPFYAGWGLTQDTLSCCRRYPVPLLQLVHAALIKYPHYFNPITKKRCEVEEVVELIALQNHSMPPFSKLYLVGFSRWKRVFMKRFASKYANELKFVHKQPNQLMEREQVLLWGAKYPELDNALRVEDGFIRSSGLGADLSLPFSLSFDFSGIYFDARKPSELENLLNGHELSDEERERACELYKLLLHTGVSKYNVGKDSVFKLRKTDKKRILVIGQVDGDASITAGSPYIKDNESLIYAVRQANPDAFIMFKPHPDVISGHRQGRVSVGCIAKCVDQVITNHPLSSLYPCLDELHTMTSLSGFEALNHGVVVHAWGQPFYSGWGLTTDHFPPQRRNRIRTLEELIYISLVLYPDYIDWNTGLYISPEMLIEKLAAEGSGKLKKKNFTQRNWLKMKYLIKALLMDC